MELVMHARNKSAGESHERAARQNASPGNCLPRLARKHCREIEKPALGGFSGGKRDGGREAHPSGRKALRSHALFPPLA